MCPIRLCSALALVVALAACESARLPFEAGVGPRPSCRRRTRRRFPTVDIAPAQGLARRRHAETRRSVAGHAFATGLSHPRWVHVLPNGDVLVAETAAPTAAGARQGHQGASS